MGPDRETVAGVRHNLVGDLTGLRGLDEPPRPRGREIGVLSDAHDPGPERARERLGGREGPPSSQTATPPP